MHIKGLLSNFLKLHTIKYHSYHLHNDCICAPVVGKTDLDPPDIQFNPQGYLILASEASEQLMRRNHQTQIECGAKVALMKPDELKEKFPWLNTDGIVLGSYGLENEGWFDPWLLLAALKAKCSNLGVDFVEGDVVDFQFKQGRPMETASGRKVPREILEKVLVKCPDNVVYPITFAACVNAAGAWSAEIAELANIGIGEGSLAVPLPVQPRKRYVYVIHCPDGPGLDMPLLVDSSCAFIRREGLGANYICGLAPKEPKDEPSTDNLDVDYDWFEEKVWPVIAQRVPAFEKLKDVPRYKQRVKLSQDDNGYIVDESYYPNHVLPAIIHRIPVFEQSQLKAAWAGYYDYNYFDENLIIGNHPYHRNMYFATGCSGHGIQQAVAIGRGISELILDSEFTSIDLSRFSFDRVMLDEPVYEENCF